MHSLFEDSWLLDTMNLWSNNVWFWNKLHSVIFVYPAAPDQGLGQSYDIIILSLAFDKYVNFQVDQSTPSWGKLRERFH